MTEFDLEQRDIRHEAAQMTARLYFTESPEHETGGHIGIGALDEVIDERFGCRIDDERWRGVDIFSIDCRPEELQMLHGVVAEMGYLPLVGYRERTTVHKLLKSGIKILPRA